MVDLSISIDFNGDVNPFKVVVGFDDLGKAALAKNFKHFKSVNNVVFWFQYEIAIDVILTVFCLLLSPYLSNITHIVDIVMCLYLNRLLLSQNRLVCRQEVLT